MWVAGKTVILITHAIPEHFRDEFITKRYTNVRIYLYPLAFYYSIVIMHVSCTFLRQRDIGRKTSTLSCPTCVLFGATGGVTPDEFHHVLWHQKTKMALFPWSYV